MGAEPQNPDRSNETRLRLIEAALDLFASQGFEGTTTRQLAQKAKANLAAIPYHFGSKEKLYHAVASHIVEGIRDRVIASIAGLEPAQSPCPTAARQALHKLFARIAEVLTSAEADRFSRFILRELMAPSAAFEIFYQGVVDPVQSRICGLIAAAAGRPPDERTLRIQAIMLFGQIAVFRFGQPVVSRRLACKTIGPEELAQIRRMLRFNLDAILDAGGSP